MSEYQFYGFLSEDQLLTPAQQRELRMISSRAEISARMFINVYNWGDLKAAPERLLEEYFDVYIHLGNWRTHNLGLKLPLAAVPDRYVDALEDCATGGARRTETHLILTMSNGDNDDVVEMDHDEAMTVLPSLRQEILAGDYRALYLFWLAAITWDQDMLGPEPPVPPGLKSLTPPQQYLAEFLGISPFLIDVAAEHSSALQESSDADILAWITALPEAEKNGLLARLLRGEGQAELVEWRRRCRQDFSDRAQQEPPPAPRRIEDMLDEGRHREEEAERAQRERQEQRRREQDARQAAERGEHLDRLISTAGRIWEQVNSLANIKNVSSYDQAAALILDLRDAAERHGRQDEFERNLAEFCAVHRRKPALMERLSRLKRA